MTCGTCGQANRDTARFCDRCGAPLAQRAVGAEERKLVTVLFADVVESTRNSTTVDPEAWRARMGQLFVISREEIERFGGTVEKFIGDAVMAVFGLPAVHEDDPERAVRAAIAIRSRLRPLIETGRLPDLRFGIMTGEVVANPEAAEKGEFLVTGEAVNLAVRLQQHARPGQVLVGERTVQSIDHVARLALVSPLTVKGRADPLPAWELLDVAAPQERKLRTTPFVGREEELTLLAGHVRRMIRDGRGHVITILGPGGAGKTRLVQELRGRAAGVQIFRGRAIPYGAGVPFWSIGEIIREECGILFGDPLEDARAKLLAAASRLGVREAVPALLAVLGLSEGNSELTREALFAGIRAFLRMMAQHGPVMVILEDMHSAEDATLDFLERAADWIRGMSIVALVLGRPELLERRAGWMGGKRGATTFFLDPLGSGESRALVRAILGGRPAPERLLAQILERAGGNPLFIEEMLRSLIERGVLASDGDRWLPVVPIDDIAIPDTIQAVIAARLDALPAPEKRVLQAAAVIGKDFYLGAVRANPDADHADDAIQALVDKELIVSKAGSSIAGEIEYTFRHILIRDVAYAMIPKAQRWTRHARAAEWLMQIAGDRRAESADVIAHHWLQVIALRGDLGLADDPAARRLAVEHLVVAGDRAARAYANTTALQHFSRVLELDPPAVDRLRALLDRGEVRMLLGEYDRARHDLAAARRLAREIAEPRVEAVALDRIGLSFRHQDQIAPALEHLEPGLALARQVRDAALTGRILNHIGFTYFSDGKPLESVRAHEEARQLLEAAQDLSPLAESLHGLGDSLMVLGRFRESIRTYLRSIQISEQLENRSLVAENLFMIALSRRVLGHYDDAHAAVLRSLAILDEIGDVWNTSAALNQAALISSALGDFGKALGSAGRGLQLSRQIAALRMTVYNLLTIGGVYRELEHWNGAWGVDSEASDLARRVGGAPLPSALAALAKDAAALGRMDDAQACLANAQQILKQAQVRADYHEELAHAEGRVFLSQGKAAEALAVGRALVEMATAAGTLFWVPPATLLIAEATLATGDLAAAAAAFTRAVDEAQRAGRRPVLWRALAGLAEAQRALRSPGESSATAAQAHKIVNELASSVPDERLREVFLQSPKVQRLSRSDS